MDEFTATNDELLALAVRHGVKPLTRPDDALTVRPQYLLVGRWRFLFSLQEATHRAA
ncbi:hypothetical protein ACFQE0_15960 [Methylobacterium komagatae]|uniref:Uncharacterized protein n=1 Tax=Methylobacterium komagatae TaxID=374425 RepID=A0ABW2BM78_9HYPH